MAEHVAAAQRGAQEHLGNFKGTIEYNDLKGKIVEWAHHTGAIRIGRVVTVGQDLIEITDATSYNHKATMKQIIGAWSKRGSRKYLRVITTKQEKKKETRKK